MAFCKGCGAKIEWHKTAAGKSMPIDPEPHPEGNMAFDASMRLVQYRPGQRPRMYRAHFVTCPKREEFRRPRAVICDRPGCEIDTTHRHCRNCGALDHFAADCPEDEST